MIRIVIADDDPFFAAERQIAQFFAEQDFHLYFLGVEMPGMSGLELSEKILTLHPGARIVLLTGRSKQENACAVSAKLTTP
nr:response regulator [uncultured Acetatifactor sp.]